MSHEYLSYWLHVENLMHVLNLYIEIKSFIKINFICFVFTILLACFIFPLDILTWNFFNFNKLSLYKSSYTSHCWMLICSTLFFFCSWVLIFEHLLIVFMPVGEKLHVGTRFIVHLLVVLLLLELLLNRVYHFCKSIPIGKCLSLYCMTITLYFSYLAS